MNATEQEPDADPGAKGLLSPAADAINKRRCKVCKKKKTLTEFEIYDVGSARKRRHTCKACSLIASIQRKCKTCKKTKPIAEFPFVRGKSGIRRHHCNFCNTARVESHHAKNMDDRLARQRAHYDAHAEEIAQDRRDRKGESLGYMLSVLRRLVTYAGGCVACGEDNPHFLTVVPITYAVDSKDLVRIPGYRESGSGLYLDIIRQGMPDELQVLCFNCKYGRRRTGGTLVFDGRTDVE
jgi:hypothetical protein